MKAYKAYVPGSTRWAQVIKPAYRLYLSEHLLRDVIPIWNHYSTSCMVISRDLLVAELVIAGIDPVKLVAKVSGYRWVHSVLTPPEGIELRIIEWPGVLAWGFI